MAIFSNLSSNGDHIIADHASDLTDTLPGNNSIIAQALSNPFFDLSTLNGTNGFVINGNFNFSIRSVSHTGDVNGDGIDDLIINEQR
jgi:hypothetical protein